MSNTTTPLLEYKNIHASYGAINALNGVSLKVYEQEIVTLIGANGAGKTSLMMSLYKQPALSQGEILFQGEPIQDLHPNEIIKQGIAISPEGRRIFPKLTTEENIRLGAYVIKDKHHIESQLKQVFDLFPILFDRKDQRSGTLSGGEQQMLAMGRALMLKPKLFFLDEPSLGLAPQLVTQIFDILKNISQLGTTIFLVEQNAHHALKLADRGYVLVNGAITLEGKGTELLSNPRVQEAYLGGH
jgi:branched-chain amino acid transport system ATP-binding protein